MRRWLMRFLPVFMLALAVQILAPVGACFASALIAADPLANAVLCKDAGNNHAPAQQPVHHMRDGSCAACAVATPFTPPAPEPEIVLLQRQAYRVVWRAAAPAIRQAKLALSAQARAPPVLS